MRDVIWALVAAVVLLSAVVANVLVAIRVAGLL
jgi:hypothetical protein